eukprot:TRINITY_DN4390_c0_g7_i1.p1 TRINITY_DN4390_c0_g7~~TRINITY_DN4390_c0_g7_i1.p1  ORF type:complete len:838 (-),score=64.87 TRINITY_DN4390_c0_g7_i1:137-2650(-)
MPGVKLGKVRVNVASDDLWYAGIPGTFFWLGWSMVLFIFLLITLDQWRNECFPEDKGTPVFVFLILAVVLHVGLSVCFIWMSVISFRGCVFEVSKRRKASDLIVAALTFFVLIVVNLIYGTIINAQDVEECDKVNGASQVVSAAVISSWIFVGIYMLIAILVYAFYPKSLDHPEHFEKFLKEISWLFGWNNIMLRTSEDGSQPPYKRLALFMYTMFKDVDLTPTDMVLALLLVATQQRNDRQEHALKVIHEYEQQQNKTSQKTSTNTSTDEGQHSIQQPGRTKQIEMMNINTEIEMTETSMKSGTSVNQDEQSSLDNKNSGDQLIDALQIVSEYAPSTPLKVAPDTVFLTPSSMYKSVKPDINPVLAADLFSKQPEYVDRETIQLAQHYCKFALAIYVYGERRKVKTIMKNQGKLEKKPSVIQRLSSSQLWLPPILKRSRSKSSSGSLEMTKSAKLQPMISEEFSSSKRDTNSIPHEGAAFPKRFVREMCDMADIQLEDLIYLTLMNDLEGILPYFISVDRQQQAVVISIRGSASLADWITDAMFEPRSFIEGFVSDEVLRELGIENVHQEYAHNGIFNCALAILKDLEQNRILDLLFRRIDAQAQTIYIEEQTLTISLKDIAANIPDCSGWKLVLTGHSLGAGVASIMALKLKATYQDVMCWCFNPPGGLLSPQMADKLSPICISIVQNKDLVSRLSALNLLRFRDKMVYALAACRWNKNQVFLSAIRRRWRQKQTDDVFFSEQEIPAEVRELLTRYQQGIQLDRQAQRQYDMLPPGKIAHIRYIKRDLKSTPIYSAVWVSAADLMLEGFLISPQVGTNHDQVNLMDVVLKIQIQQ